MRSSCGHRSPIYPATVGYRRTNSYCNAIERNHVTQVPRIPADIPYSSSRNRNRYVNWKHQQQPGRGDSGQLSGEREQQFEFDRKLNGEHGFYGRGTDESRE